LLSVSPFTHEEQRSQEVSQRLCLAFTARIFSAVVRRVGKEIFVLFSGRNLVTIKR
jgi:hypothetical protein